MADLNCFFAFVKFPNPFTLLPLLSLYLLLTIIGRETNTGISFMTTSERNRTSESFFASSLSSTPFTKLPLFLFCLTITITARGGDEVGRVPIHPFKEVHGKLVENEISGSDHRGIDGSGRESL